MQCGGECYYECSTETLLSLKNSSVPLTAYHWIDSSVKFSFSEQQCRVGNGENSSPRKKVTVNIYDCLFEKFFLIMKQNRSFETPHHYINSRAWEVGWNLCSINHFKSLSRVCLLHPSSREISDFPVSFSKMGKNMGVKENCHFLSNWSSLRRQKNAGLSAWYWA